MPRHRSSKSTSKSSSSARDGSKTKPRPRAGDQRGALSEAVKISITSALEKFANAEDEAELVFPAEFTSAERAYIHQMCKTYGLQSKSSGLGNERRLVVTRRAATSVSDSLKAVNIRPKVLSILSHCIESFPEEADAHDHHKDGFPVAHRHKKPQSTGSWWDTITAAVPPRPFRPKNLAAFRQGLPVWPLQARLVSLIKSQQVILISGGTGCGKTTQVPQFVLDDASTNGHSVRIICTQPRRLSAIGVAERVAAERGEHVGGTVGYAIRLESRMSGKSLLTFCTNGILLKLLMDASSSLDSVTHIIVDEIHERDRHCDLLLVTLRNLLTLRPKLRLILMSATMNAELFIKYFEDCPHEHVDGSTYSVATFYLREVLALTGYRNIRMSEILAAESSTDGSAAATDDRLTRAISGLASVTSQMKTATEERELVKAQRMGTQSPKEDMDAEEDAATPVIRDDREDDEDVEESDDDDVVVVSSKFVDSDDFDNNSDGEDKGEGEQEEEVAAASHAAAANPDDAAALRERAAVVAETEARHGLSAPGSKGDESLRLLRAYQRSFDDDWVDVQLIVTLIEKVAREGVDGAILVFLPGYEDIVAIKETLQTSSINSSIYVIMLHSLLQPSDQRKVFKSAPHGMRKVVLSTNIAETSITIDDVVFVIDSGKVREKSYDSAAGVSTLQVGWVSRASAIQRRGRAGRCQEGICYHLMSFARFKSLPEHQEPEILRIPLQELCLHSKLLTESAGSVSSIADYLSQAPDPPSMSSLVRAVQSLKQIGALDGDENMTVLGKQLASLSVLPHLAKMVLYGVLFRCLDPVVTIACALSYRDPFVIPPKGQKQQAQQARLQFSCGLHSDHVAVYTAYQEWDRHAGDNAAAADFCHRKFLSNQTLLTIRGMRGQLFRQLDVAGFISEHRRGLWNINSGRTQVLKAILCAALYPSVARKNPANHRYMTASEKSVRLHASSVLSETVPSSTQDKKQGSKRDAVGEMEEEEEESQDKEWLVFEELTRIHSIMSVKFCTAVSSLSLMLLADNYSKNQEQAAAGQAGTTPAAAVASQDASALAAEDHGSSTRGALVIDDWISFHLPPAVLATVQAFRLKLHRAFVQLLRHPKAKTRPPDQALIQAAVNAFCVDSTDPLAGYEDAAASHTDQEHTGRRGQRGGRGRQSAPRNIDSPDRFQGGGRGQQGGPNISRGRGLLARHGRGGHQQRHATWDQEFHSDFRNTGRSGSSPPFPRCSPEKQRAVCAVADATTLSSRATPAASDLSDVASTRKQHRRRGGGSHLRQPHDADALQSPAAAVADQPSRRKCTLADSADGAANAWPSESRTQTTFNAPFNFAEFALTIDRFSQGEASTGDNDSCTQPRRGNRTRAAAKRSSVSHAAQGAGFSAAGTSASCAGVSGAATSSTGAAPPYLFLPSDPAVVSWQNPSAVLPTVARQDDVPKSDLPSMPSPIPLPSGSGLDSWRTSSAAPPMSECHHDMPKSNQPSVPSPIPLPLGAVVSLQGSRTAPSIGASQHDVPKSNRPSAPSPIPLPSDAAVVSWRGSSTASSTEAHQHDLPKSYHRSPPSPIPLPSDTAVSSRGCSTAPSTKAYQHSMPKPDRRSPPSPILLPSDTGVVSWRGSSTGPPSVLTTPQAASPTPCHDGVKADRPSTSAAASKPCTTSKSDQQAMAEGTQEQSASPVAGTQRNRRGREGIKLAAVWSNPPKPKPK